MVPTFSNFCSYRSQRTFQKNSNSDFQVWLLFTPTKAEFNAESIGNNLQSQKWKRKKLVYPFLIALFHFETNLIKQWFLLFSGPFCTVGKFLPRRSEAEKISWFRQKNILLINLVPKVPNLYIRTKYTLKICVTTVHLLHCITNFFIHLCFWRTNLWWIKEHPSWETSVNIKKFFWFVYTRLHSSTFV